MNSKMKAIFALLLVYVSVSPNLCSALTNRKTGGHFAFNVVNYGAKGDGQTDDSNAFLKAWQAVCGAPHGSPTLIIPEGKTFMLQPVSFRGPCKSATVKVKLMGTIIAPHSLNWKWTNADDSKAWIQFAHINGLVVYGGGIFDGQGALWWNSVGKRDQVDRPTAVQYLGCDNLKLLGLKHYNSPRNHISIASCNGAYVSNLLITAPEDSPNTDGFDISTSTNIIIVHSTISTGDDCVAINSGSKSINITDVYCGPGHGISVGSLGKDGEFAIVEEVHVKNITFQGTTNGARIKTWVGGRGYARKITYEDIKLIEVRNPVIIDQQYNPYSIFGLERAVKVSDVTYRNIRGTSNDTEAVDLNCDQIGCNNIVFEEINIVGLNGETTTASCNHAQGSSSSCNPKITCLY